MLKTIMFHIPEDPDLVVAFGEVVLRHEHMNHVLKMTIRSLTGVTVDEALAATKHEGSKQLRDRIRKIAKKRLGEGAPLLKLQAIIANCERLTDKRNELIHGLWAKELDGEAHVRDAHGKTRPLPSAKELRELGSEIEKLTKELIFERLEGFLKQALSNERLANKGA